MSCFFFFPPFWEPLQIKGFDIGIYESDAIGPQTLLEVWHFQYSSSNIGFSKEVHDGVQHLHFGLQQSKR